MDPSRRRLHIAVEGCAHGELDVIYNSLAALEQRRGFKTDLLIICGDFEVRAWNWDPPENDL